MHVEKVQRMVMSALLGTVGFVFATGLCLLAGISDGPDAQPGSQPGLMVVAAVVGMATVAGVRTINQRSIVTPWLLVGAIPAAVAAWLILG